ncbi:hypothetical protein J2Y66_001311 [Paenarthrobacter nitroguajacolicus]|uniref:hypothetical protein n=1 Tax=Paenarthrobacter nitroguajacolicus TaxID=211146 RepID=UPI00285EA2A4|nr:hypothetical protein [Paenarthrobacter nitroguajacolicus]MDR6986841.1 hypothetical protein [Paenarthrobacter nitroguajacolicus]
MNVPWDNRGIDDEHAAWQAPQHLPGLGHWDLAVLSSTEHPIVTMPRSGRGQTSNHLLDTKLIERKTTRHRR